MLRRIALILALGAAACQQVQLPSPLATGAPPQLPLQLEIPSGYRGYVVLQYALVSCPLLPRREGYTVIRFGDDGRACTSEGRTVLGGTALTLDTSQTRVRLRHALI